MRGRRVELSQKEFALLRTLAAEPTRVFTKEERMGLPSDRAAACVKAQVHEAQTTAPARLDSGGAEAQPTSQKVADRVGPAPYRPKMAHYRLP